jgi:hypothetical protein
MLSAAGEPAGRGGAAVRAAVARLHPDDVATAPATVCGAATGVVGASRSARYALTGLVSGRAGPVRLFRALRRWRLSESSTAVASRNAWLFAASARLPVTSKLLRGLPAVVVFLSAGCGSCEQLAAQMRDADLGSGGPAGHNPRARRPWCTQAAAQFAGGDRTGQGGVGPLSVLGTPGHSAQSGRHCQGGARREHAATAD